LSNRHQRRSSARDFRRLSAGASLTTYLVECGTPLDGHALLQNPVARCYATYAARKTGLLLLPQGVRHQRGRLVFAGHVGFGCPERHRLGLPQCASSAGWKNRTPRLITGRRCCCGNWCQAGRSPIVGARRETAACLRPGGRRAARSARPSLAENFAAAQRARPIPD
jgi:hypothetical protein